jgi:hypothetical protein
VKIFFISGIIVLLVAITTLAFTLTNSHPTKKTLSAKQKITMNVSTTEKLNKQKTNISIPNVVKPFQSNAIIGFNSPSYPGEAFPENSAIISIAAPLNSTGYWVLHMNGEITAYNVPNYGSLPKLPQGDFPVSIAPDYQTGGYWVLDSFGNIYAFNAPNLGHVYIPTGGWGQYPEAVALVSSLKQQGYYILRANGEIDAFNLPYWGSLKGQLYYGATAPITAVSMAIDYLTTGYWILTSTGNVFTFNAPNLKTNIPMQNNAPFIEITSLYSQGFYVLDGDGQVTPVNEPNYGSLSNLPVGAQASSMAIDPVTKGYRISLNYSPYEGYVNPLRKLSSLVPQEIDQGVDYCGFGPIYPIGDAVIVNVYSSGWPNNVFIAYRLTQGPLSGYYIYVAENVTPYVTVGENVTPRTALGYLNDQGNCLETGWASFVDPHGFAQAHNQYNGSNSTAYGINFSNLLELLGTKPGLVQNNGAPGPLPQNWPQF